LIYQQLHKITVNSFNYFIYLKENPINEID